MIIVVEFKEIGLIVLATGQSHAGGQDACQTNGGQTICPPFAACRSVMFYSVCGRPAAFTSGASFSYLPLHLIMVPPPAT